MLGAAVGCHVVDKGVLVLAEWKAAEQINGVDQIFIGQLEKSPAAFVGESGLVAAQDRVHQLLISGGSRCAQKIVTGGIGEVGDGQFGSLKDRGQGGLDGNSGQGVGGGDARLEDGSIK